MCKRLSKNRKIKEMKKAIEIWLFFFKKSKDNYMIRAYIRRIV